MKTKEARGITIISLAVTIIIMLILAGVTISSLTSENGILTKTKLAKQMSEVSSEKEAIQLDVTLANMENGWNSTNKYYIGIPLYDKTIENGNKWSIIVENDSQKVYGTDWSYIAQGTEIENYGKTQYNWLVNYYSGEIKQLEENTYTQLMYGSNLAVKDKLVLNIDPINMEDSRSWGEGVTLNGVSDGDGYGWNGTEIKFDGVDDYIEVSNCNFKADDGLTFEFYAKNENSELNSNMPILSKSLPITEYSGIRTLIVNNQVQISFGFIDSKSDWSNSNMPHWLFKNSGQDFCKDDGGYISIVVNKKNNEVSLYGSGELIGSTKVDDKWIRTDILENSEVPFLIGKRYGYEKEIVNSIYGKMNIYACRLYNKVLNADEIKENYDKTVAYHNLLVNK